jgi:acetylornithine deacetylase
MSHPQGRILQEAQAGDPVALARALVSTPSVNPRLEECGAGEAAIARLTADWMRAWGLAVEVSEVAPGRWNVVGRLGGEGIGPTLLLNGHLDTVGVAGMSVEPFGAELRAGRLWGRGSCDMKGGVAVCEPTSLAVMPAHKGFVWVEAVFHGRAAHGSRPEVGVDAIEHAGLYLAALGALRSRLCTGEPHPLLGYGSFHAGTIRGGSAPSVYPDACRLVLERRTLPGEDTNRVVEEFQGVLDDLAGSVPELEAKLTLGLARSASEVPLGSPLVAGLRAACVDEGVEPTLAGMTAWVDAAFLNEAGTPAVCFGPGSIAQAHSVDEWIDPAEIVVCAAVLERFSREFLQGDTDEMMSDVLAGAQ